VFSANQRPASIYIMYVWTMVNSMAPMLSIWSLLYLQSRPTKNKICLLFALSKQLKVKTTYTKHSVHYSWESIERAVDVRKNWRPNLWGRVEFIWALWLLL